MLLAGGDLPSTMARDVTFHRRQRRSFQQVPLHRLAPQAKAQSTTNIYSLALRCPARTGRRKAGWHETNLHVWVATILPLHFLGFEFPGRCLKVIYNPTAPGVGFWPAKQKIVGGRTPEPKWIDREKSAIKTAALLSQKSFSLLWTCLSHVLQASIRHYTIFCKPTNKLTTATLVFLWAKKRKTLSHVLTAPPSQEVPSHNSMYFDLSIQCTWNCQFNVLGIFIRICFCVFNFFRLKQPQTAMQELNGGLTEPWPFCQWRCLGLCKNSYGFKGYQHSSFASLLYGPILSLWYDLYRLQTKDVSVRWTGVATKARCVGHVLYFAHWWGTAYWACDLTASGTTFWSLCKLFGDLCIAPSLNVVLICAVWLRVFYVVARILLPLLASGSTLSPCQYQA